MAFPAQSIPLLPRGGREVPWFAGGGWRGAAGWVGPGGRAGEASCLARARREGGSAFRGSRRPRDASRPHPIPPPPARRRRRRDGRDPAGPGSARESRRAGPGPRKRSGRRRRSVPTRAPDTAPAGRLPRSVVRQASPPRATDADRRGGRGKGGCREGLSQAPRATEGEGTCERSAPGAGSPGRASLPAPPLPSPPAAPPALTRGGRASPAGW